MNTTSLKVLVAAALVSLLPACKRQSAEAGSEIRVVEVPVAATCAPAAAAPAPAPTTAPALAKDTSSKTTASKSTPSAKKADGSALKVTRFVVATNVERKSRQPEGASSTFTKGEFEKLYAFVELENPGDEADVVVSFDPPSSKPEKGNVELAVGRSPGWRTWAFSRGFDEKGSWSAVVRTKDGKELARTDFEVL
jgi:hypothetical protein